MPSLESLTLWAHIAAGVVALVAGVGAILTAKGGDRHRTAGKVFVASMAVVVGTVLPLLALDPTTLRVFLTLVAVFSGYLAFSGYRVLARKRPAAEPATVDWVAGGAAVLACLALGGWGAVWLLDGQQFGTVMLVFGGIGLAMGGSDLVRFRRQAGGDAWLVTHLQRMLAAFIATVSAVSAVNLTPYMGFLAWLWPTLVGAPLIAYWSREYDG